MSGSGHVCHIFANNDKKCQFFLLSWSKKYFGGMINPMNILFLIVFQFFLMSAL